MLRRIFGIDSSFTSVMGKLADIILVSLLWIVCSILLITIATSASAFYYALVKGVRKDRGTPTHEFLDFFKKNWKQGIGVSLIYIALGALAALNFYVVSKMGTESAIYAFYEIESLWVILLYIFLTIFLFPVFSRFEYGCFDVVKTSLLMSIKHTFSSLWMSAMFICVALFTAKYPILTLVLPGIMTVVFSLRIEKIFRKYMKKPEDGETLPWYWDDRKGVVQNDE
ncbi:MAG: YesL family protein [Oliverpabstia sp.]